MIRHIHCTKHGLVGGYFCRECKAERYVQDVKEGKIQPEQLIEYNERPESELLPLQIRFRAYMERSKRKQMGKAHSWEMRCRTVRIISSEFLEG